MAKDDNNSEALDETIDNGKAPDATLEEAARSLNAIVSDDDNKTVDPAPAADKDKKKDPLQPQYAEDPRDRIAASHRESRGKPPVKVEGDDEIDPNSLAATYGADAVATQQDDATAAAAAPGVKVAAPAAIDPNTPITIKVNGVDRVMSYADVLKSAQKVEAADETFRNASLLVKNLGGTKPQASTPTDGGESQDGARPSTEDAGKTSTPKGTKFDTADLTKVAEALTLGTTEDGAKALGELLEKVAQPAAPVDLSNQVEFTIAARDVRNESMGAADAFLKKYPALASDPILQQVSGQLVAQEMAKDLVAAGLSPEVIEAKLQTPAQVKAYYETVRAVRPDFGRKMSELMTAAESSNHFQALTGGKTAPLKVNLDRSDRKAALPQQPALRSPPTLQRQENDNQPVDIGASRSNAVQKMREARGQRRTA